MRIQTLLAISSLGFGTALDAQSRYVFPGPLATAEGERLTSGPFGYTEIRAQQVWRGEALTSGVAVLFGMAFRADVGSRANVPGRNYSSFTVSVGYSANGPNNLDATFANNVSGTLTTVWSGPYSLPTQTGGPGTAPFNITWMFTAPFVYSKAMGNLLVEIVGVNQNGKSSYFLDATDASGSGPFGASGTISSGDALRLLSGNTTNNNPGGQMVFRGETDLASYPSALFIGSSNRSIGGVPLPFELSPVGAPGNSLYTDVVLTVNWALAPQTTGYATEFVLPIPNNPTIGGLSLFGQCFVQHAPSNNLGVVTSNGYEFKIGATGPITGQVYHWDPTSATGLLSPGGPVVEFNGVF